MTFLPVAERELRTASRQPATFWVRVLAAGLASALGGAMLVFQSLVPQGTALGRALFSALAGLLALLCLLEGARSTADCLSQEKREGTLGLLFLTDLKGYDIVLGKLLAAALRPFYALLGVLPILSLAIPLGGVSGAEFFRMALALTNLLGFSLAMGMAVSAFSRQGRSAFGLALALTALFSLLPLGLAKLLGALAQGPNSALIATLSPLIPIHQFSDASYRLQPEQFWLALGLTQLASASALALAAWWVPRSWQERRPQHAAPSTAAVRTPADIETARQARQSLLDANPAFWLFRRHRSSRWALIFALGLVLIALGVPIVEGSLVVLQPTTLATAMLLSWAVKIGWTLQACGALAEARHSGAFGLLLATPLTDHQILHGHGIALWKTWAAPAAILLGLQALAALSPFLRDGLPPFEAQHLVTLAVPGLQILTLIADFFALFWAGSWFGLRDAQTNRATIKTLLLVQVAPSLLCCGLRLLTDFVFIFWARSRCFTQLRWVLQGERGPAPPLISTLRPLPALHPIRPPSH